MSCTNASGHIHSCPGPQTAHTQLKGVTLMLASIRQVPRTLVWERSSRGVLWEKRGDHSPASVCCPVQQAPCGPFASNLLVSDKETLVQGGWVRSPCFLPFKAIAVRTRLPVSRVSGQQPVGWQENATVVGVARCHWSIQEAQRGCHTRLWQRTGQGQLPFLTSPTVRGWTSPPALPLITS